MGENNYLAFIEAKTHDRMDGFDPLWIPDFLYDFQRKLLDWSIRKGSSAIFADCGLGKTPMQLVWAQNIVMNTSAPVLILTPLAVSYQTIEEAGKFGIDAKRVSHQDECSGSAIYVTNYERLHHFNAEEFSGVVCDESSILKSFDGVRRGEITAFMRKMPYRLLCTATASPNDYTELGTSSEAIGELGYMDMLVRFFKNEQNTVNPNRLWDGSQWRFKRHAEVPFWKWVVTWARAVRRPSDIGCDDNGFILPSLNIFQHHVTPSRPRDDLLFDVPPVGLREERGELRRTMTERCQFAADLANSSDLPHVVWCHLNQEGDMLEKMIHGSIQVSGRDSDDEKEAKFIGFRDGRYRVMITKPKIGGFGLNWQHCANVIYFPSHSYEQYYQAVRRCWRFGQENEVRVDIVMPNGMERLMRNLSRKAAAADKMFSDLVALMNQSMGVRGVSAFDKETGVPEWLSQTR